MRGKLPMNPWLYILLVVSLLGIGAWGMSTGRMEWYDLTSSAALALQFAWIFQAGGYAFGKADQKLGNPQARVKRKGLIIGALICLAMNIPLLILAFHYFADPSTGTITGTPALFFMLVVLFTLVLALTVIFQVAKALCQAEDKATGERIFVTCLLMVYLIIGAPFLYRRLKRLDPVET